MRSINNLLRSFSTDGITTVLRKSYHYHGQLPWCTALNHWCRYSKKSTSCINDAQLSPQPVFPPSRQSQAFRQRLYLRHAVPVCRFQSFAQRANFFNRDIGNIMRNLPKAKTVTRTLGSRRISLRSMAIRTAPRSERVLFGSSAYGSSVAANVHGTDDNRLRAARFSDRFIGGNRFSSVGSASRSMNRNWGTIRHQRLPRCYAQRLQRRERYRCWRKLRPDVHPA